MIWSETIEVCFIAALERLFMMLHDLPQQVASTHFMFVFPYSSQTIMMLNIMIQSSETTDNKLCTQLKSYRKTMRGQIRPDRPRPPPPGLKGLQKH